MSSEPPAGRRVTGSPSRRRRKWSSWARAPEAFFPWIHTRRAARMAWTAWSKASGESCSAVFSRQACCCSSQAAGEKLASWRRVPAIFTAGPVACSSTRALRALKSRQPAWRAKRETVASDRSSRWASCPMVRKRKLSVVVLMKSRIFCSARVSSSGGTEICSSMEPTSFQLRL